jgi:concanavalin A-like lectin/glucanase superfamily protein
MAAAVAGTGCIFDDAGLAPGVDAPPPIDAGPADAEIDAPPPPFCDATDPDLVACYRFEAFEHPAQPFDESMYANHGISAGASIGPGHDDGSAMVFNASSDVRIPDSVSLDVTEAITLEAWLKPTALPGANGRAGIVDDNSQYAMFLSPAGEIRCSINTTTVIDLVVPVGSWSHVACVYDRQTLVLYLNGIAGTPLRSTVPLNTSGTDGIALGQNSPAGDDLNGSLDDVRIWRTARTPAQICAAAGPACIGP